MKMRTGVRKFLNKPGFHDRACIIAEVEDTSKKKSDSLNRWDAIPHVKLLIADCDKKVTFDFDWDTPSDRKNSLQKVDVMIDALVKFREALEAEQKLYAERKKVNGW